MSRNELTVAAEKDFANNSAEILAEDPRVTTIAEVWSRLPEHIKTAIMALIGTVKE